MLDIDTTGYTPTALGTTSPKKRKGTTSSGSALGSVPEEEAPDTKTLGIGGALQDTLHVGTTSQMPDATKVPEGRSDSAVTPAGVAPVATGDMTAAPTQKAPDGQQWVWDGTKKKWVLWDLAGNKEAASIAPMAQTGMSAAPTTAAESGTQWVWDGGSQSWILWDLATNTALQSQSPAVVAGGGAGSSAATGAGGQATSTNFNLEQMDPALQARQAAEQAAMAAQSRSLGAAQAQGLSSAAGANAGAAQGTGAYTDTYGKTLTDLSQQKVAMRGQDIDAAITARGQDVTKYLGQIQNDFNVAGLDFKKAQADKQAGGQAWQAFAQGVVDLLGQQGIMATLSAVTAWLFPMLSDERAKTEIKDGHGLLDAVANAVRGHSFKYKGSDHPENGVMAQDLEKTPLRSAVVPGPDGMKTIDTDRLTTANTAMITELSRKLDKAMSYFQGAK